MMTPENKALAERINAKLAGSSKWVTYECGLWRVCDIEGSKPRLIDDLAALEAELAVPVPRPVPSEPPQTPSRAKPVPPAAELGLKP
jgi:hypothetical protein